MLPLKASFHFRLKFIMKFGFYLFLFILASSSLIAQISKDTLSNNPKYRTQIFTEFPSKELPLLKSRQEKINLLKNNNPQILLLENATSEQKKATEIAIGNTNFIKYVRNERNELLLNEIFGVYPVRPGDINDVNLRKESILYRVEMYNFAINLSTIGIVDITADSLIQFYHLPDTQPDIPKSLIDLALQIATNSKEIIEALGYKPDEVEALMASTKTALNRTKCERSQHVCVAPTFIKEDKALWAIVDLTDLKIAGIRWTNVGNTGPSLVTERKLQDEFINESYCQTENTFEKDGWKINYHLTTSDGLEIANVSFMNTPVLISAKLVDWHVSYSSTEGFGYSDAIGCPLFSQATVFPNEPPKISSLKDENDNYTGFILEQKYFNPGWPKPCNYNYVQRYEFYLDGSFRVSAASIGRGCGNDGTYRPVFRIAFHETKQFSEWKADSWDSWKFEKWNLQNNLTQYFQNRFQFKIDTKFLSYYLEPSLGQFGDGGRGDNAFTYITKPKKGEGDGNLITIGPCCNIDYKQGPEKFIENEEIDKDGFVLWYVPQMKNDDRVGHEYCWAESVLVNGIYIAKTFPCFAGPKFILKKP